MYVLLEKKQRNLNINYLSEDRKKETFLTCIGSVDKGCFEETMLSKISCCKLMNKKMILKFILEFVNEYQKKYTYTYTDVATQFYWVRMKKTEKSFFVDIKMVSNQQQIAGANALINFLNECVKALSGQITFILSGAYRFLKTGVVKADYLPDLLNPEVMKDAVYLNRDTFRQIEEKWSRIQNPTKIYRLKLAYSENIYFFGDNEDKYNKESELMEFYESMMTFFLETISEEKFSDIDGDTIRYRMLDNDLFVGGFYLDFLSKRLSFIVYKNLLPMLVSMNVEGQEEGPMVVDFKVSGLLKRAVPIKKLKSPKNLINLLNTIYEELEIAALLDDEHKSYGVMFGKARRMIYFNDVMGKKCLELIVTKLKKPREMVVNELIKESHNAQTWTFQRENVSHSKYSALCFIVNILGEAVYLIITEKDDGGYKRCVQLYLEEDTSGIEKYKNENPRTMYERFEGLAETEKVIRLQR